MDPWLAEAGHAWAAAVSAGMFVGAVAENAGPDAATHMLVGGEAALERFGTLLRQRR